MNGLEYSEDGVFSHVFLPSENEDCLVSMLNALAPMESPLVSATFQQNGALAVVYRENSAIYIANCKNQKGQTVEISLILGMDHSMEPMLVQTFMKMAMDQQTVKDDKKFCVTAIMFVEEARYPEEEHHKRIMVMENKENAEGSSQMEHQKFIVYSYDKFKFRDFTAMEELWLTFLYDTNSDILVKNPALPNEIRKAMNVAHGFTEA